MKNESIIVVGAGAAGLMAARILCKKGIPVTVLEANNRTGGRIHTIRDNGFTQPVEMGAEFVHGELPETLKLLREARLHRQRTEWNAWQYRDNKLMPYKEFGSEWEKLVQKMKKVKEDMTMKEFMDKNFSDDRYEDLRRFVKGYVEGYDAADMNKASVLALKEEWNNEEDEQHRITGGYGSMIDYLTSEIEECGGLILLAHAVSEIRWGEEGVQAVTDRGIYEASKVIMAVPLGIWQTEKGTPGHVAFLPEIEEKRTAAMAMGNGAGIKILMQFKDAFWEEHDKDMGRLGFLFSDERIPTWWTQLPGNRALLTGWLTGPRAMAYVDHSDEEILQIAKETLCKIFKKEPGEIEDLLTAQNVSNWQRNTYAKGMYSYPAIHSKTAREILHAPLGNVVHFAGEALYDGPEIGTVEAALMTGKLAAKEVMQ